MGINIKKEPVLKSKIIINKTKPKKSKKKKSEITNFQKEDSDKINNREKKDETNEEISKVSKKIKNTKFNKPFEKKDFLKNKKMEKNRISLKRNIDIKIKNEKTKIKNKKYKLLVKNNQFNDTEIIKFDLTTECSNNYLNQFNFFLKPEELENYVEQ